jgi:hypothetical protein
MLMYDLSDREFLGKLNSATKYPETPTYHFMDKKSGLLQENEVVDFVGDTVQVTEKIDGTNGRIIVLPSGICRQNWVIGSREDLLSCDDDVMINPNLGIVDALRETADRISDFHFDHGILDVRAYFFEVYGGTVGTKAREYSTDREVFGHRLFDVIEFSPELFRETMSHNRASIAAWRDRGNQPFLDFDDFIGVIEDVNLDPVPLLKGDFTGVRLPRTFQEALSALNRWFPDGSEAKLDSGAHGRPEGVVLKSHDRTQTAKMRFSDYESTIRRIEADAKKAAKQREKDAVIEQW